jgi:hypothetical protein
MNIEQPSSDFSINQDLSDLIPLSEASQISGLSAGHLRLLVSTGQLWGIKMGRDWFTNRQALSSYIEEGHKPGPKSRKKGT